MKRVRLGMVKMGDDRDPCSVCGDVPPVLARPHKPDPMRAGVCERCARRAAHMFDLYAKGRIKETQPRRAEGGR